MKKNDSKNEFISLLGRFFTEYLPVSVNASPNTTAAYDEPQAGAERRRI